MLTLGAWLSSSLGCQAIVGSGDYAVGSSSGATDDSGSDATASSSSSGAGSSSSSSSTSSSSGATGTDAATHVGDPCATNADCPHGSTCQGLWCTQPCTASAACGANSAKQPNLCVPNANGVGKSCVPGCQITSDCDAYAGTTCMVTSGATSGYCATTSTSGAGGRVGDPCASNTDCASPATCIGTWCTVSCDSDAANGDTVCGSNSNNVPNHCIDDSNGQNVCFPGCTTNQDCLGFPGTVCESFTGTQICAGTAGLVGDPCSTSTTTWASCDTDAGEMCINDTWCVLENCVTDTECSTATAGTPNYCVPSGLTNSVDGGAVNICFPGCKQYADCAVYSGTFCQPIVGSTRGFVCASSGGNIGDPCASNADCTDGSCGASGWCTTSCASASDTTTCGTNLQGVSNECTLDPVSDSFLCSPGCTMQSDCIPYAGTSCIVVSGHQVCD
jgi:hypothetical protein